MLCALLLGAGGVIKAIGVVSGELSLLPGTGNPQIEEKTFKILGSDRYKGVTMPAALRDALPSGALSRRGAAEAFLGALIGVPELVYLGHPAIIHSNVKLTPEEEAALLVNWNRKRLEHVRKLVDEHGKENWLKRFSWDSVLPRGIAVPRLFKNNLLTPDKIPTLPRKKTVLKFIDEQQQKMDDAFAQPEVAALLQKAQDKVSVYNQSLMDKHVAKMQTASIGGFYGPALGLAAGAGVIALVRKLTKLSRKVAQAKQRVQDLENAAHAGQDVALELHQARRRLRMMKALNIASQIAQWGALGGAGIAGGLGFYADRSVRNIFNVKRERA